MALAHTFAAVTGTHRNDCRWLGHRADAAGFDPERCESWVGSSTAERLSSVMVQRGWSTDIHETPGRTWVCTSSGRVYEYAKPKLQGKRSEHVVGGVLRGLWGPRDDHVFAWGTLRGRGVVHHHDGTRWSSADSDRPVVRVHGDADGQNVLAVADGGHVLRWVDGDLQPEHRIDAQLTGLAVTSSSEAWAVSDDGRLFRRHAGDWSLVDRIDRPLYCVASWRSETWVGGQRALFVLRDGSLQKVRDTFDVLGFDTRDTLLMVTPTHLVSGDDGVRFKGHSVAAFQRLSASKPVPW